MWEDISSSPEASQMLWRQGAQLLFTPNRSAIAERTNRRCLLVEGMLPWYVAWWKDFLPGALEARGICFKMFESHKNVFFYQYISPKSVENSTSGQKSTKKQVSQKKKHKKHMCFLKPLCMSTAVVTNQSFLTYSGSKLSGSHTCLLWLNLTHWVYIGNVLASAWNWSEQIFW